MLGIQEKYNTFKGSSHFTKLKAGGRFAIYALGIYLAATVTIGCLGLIIGSIFLTLPLAMLIFHPVAWVVMGVVLTATCKMVVEPLFHLVKGYVDGKEASKEKESNAKTSALSKLPEQTVNNQGNPKTPDGDSGTVPDSESVSKNNSRRNSNASGDSGLGGKEFHEDLQTLMHQTNLKKCDYLLQQHDIAHIARVEYGYSESSTNNVFFSIPGDVNSLNERLKEYKNKVEQENSKKTFTAVVNIGNYHWVTLVVVYEPTNKRFRAYYCDSFGNKLPNEIEGKVKDDVGLANEITEKCLVPLNNHREHLIREREVNQDNAGLKDKKDDIEETLDYARKGKNKLVSEQINGDYIVSILQETLQIGSGDNIRSSATKQQEDNCNCGIFALENAHRITQMLNNGKSFDEIDRELSKYKPNPEQLEEKRREFTEALMKDEEWKEAIAEGGILHDTLRQLALEDSKKGEIQPATSSFMQDVVTTCTKYLGFSN